MTLPQNLYLEIFGVSGSVTPICFVTGNLFMENALSISYESLGALLTQNRPCMKVGLGYQIRIDLQIA